MQGVITSPIYLNGTGDVTCSYDVDMTGNTDVVLVTMKQFSLPNGTLDVTFNNKTTTLSGKTKKEYRIYLAIRRGFPSLYSNYK